MNIDLAPAVPQPNVPNAALSNAGYNQGMINPISNQSNDEDTIDLHEYWLIIRRNKWGIMGLSFTIALLTIVVVFSLNPIYKGTTTIILETQQIKAVSIEEVYGLDSGNMEYFNSQVGIIESRNIAQRVIEKLKLNTNKEFDPRQNESRINFSLNDILPESLQKPDEELTDYMIMQMVVDQFIEQLSVTLQRKSQLVEISFESKSAELAAQVATEMAEAYISMGFEANLEVTQKAVGWLTERLSGLKAKLDESEKKLFDYRSKEGLLDVQGVQTVSAKELEDISDKLIDTKRDRMTLQATYRQIKSIKSHTVQDYETIPGLLDSVSVQRAKESMDTAEEKVTELSKIYGMKHPKMKSAQANYNKVYSNYLRLLKNVAKGIERQYNAIRSNEYSLKKEMSRSKGDIRTINKKSFKLKELQSEVDSNRRLYDTFFSRFKETNETSGMQTANARIVDEAVVPNIPVKPKKKLIVIIATILGLGLGVVIAFLQEALNKTIRTAADVEEKLGVSLLGILPLLKKKKIEDKDIALLSFIEENKSNFAEAIRTIRTGVVLSGLDNDEKIAVVTSSVPNEGKTTVAINLAMALGQSEKVLLIDGDLRRPSIGKTCKIDNKNGLSTLVAGTTSFDDSMHTFEEWGIDVLPAGIVPPNPQELLGSIRFGKVIKALGRKYDRIVIDTAPIQAVSDAQLISVHCNEVIFVVKADATPYSLAYNSIDKFRQINRHVTGVVLNQMNVAKATKYYTGDYYNGYYQNYGYN